MVEVEISKFSSPTNRNLNIMKTKTLVNRKGRNGDCRNYIHAYTIAKLEHKAEHFMCARTMRAYWNDKHDPLYGPLRLMSRYLNHKHRIV